MAKDSDTKREKRNKIMTLFIAIIMISSVFGVMFYGFSSGSDKIKYGDYTFLQTDWGYRVNVDGQTFDFAYFPTDVEDITLRDSLRNKILNTKMIYLTYDPESPIASDIAIAQYSLNQRTGNFGVFASVATTTNISNMVPVIGCENATQFVPVIEFRESNITKFVEDGDCIIAEADSGYNFQRLADRLIYSLAGII